MNFSSPLPFELGETQKGTDPDGNIVTPDWAGKLFYLSPNNMAAARLAPRRSGHQLIGVPLLNNSGITLLGKRCARLKRAGGVDDLHRVDGYSAVLAEKGVVIIDEFLATAGVADKYYFWGILDGPVTVLTSTVGADFNGDISIGDLLVAATGATTGNSTSGRVSSLVFTAATAGNTSNGFDGFKAAMHVVGRALSARTTAETASDLLINAMIRY
jgi:hypothetical protein